MIVKSQCYSAFMREEKELNRRVTAFEPAKPLQVSHSHDSRGSDRKKFETRVRKPPSPVTYGAAADEEG